MMRYHYMDALRASLLIAGVFFHAGMVYRPDLAWRFRDPSDLVFFSWLTDLLHSFRMPAFFVMAGFFCALTFHCNGGVRKLRARLITFCVPFVVMVFTVQPWQYAMELGFHDAFRGFGATFWTNYFRDGEYISHLWFLLNLVVYYIGAWLLLVAAPARNYLSSPWLAAAFRSKTVLSALACLAYLPFMLALRGTAIGTEYELELIFRYAPFFAAGFVMYRSAQLLEQFERITLADLFYMLLVLLLVLKEPAGPVGRLVDILWFYQCGFVLTALCIMLFHKFVNRENRLTRLISEAGYTIYLLHHFLVVLIATLVAGWLPKDAALLKYTIVVSLVLALTVAAHQLLIARYPLLRFLFNGKWRNAGARPDAALARSAA